MSAIQSYPRSIVESSVELPDGSRVHYARSGPFDGPSVFFVHGWTDWSVTFRRVIDELPGHVHAIAISLPGIGGSDPISEPARPSDMAGAVIAVADRLGVTRAVFVGQSMGGPVCQRVAGLRTDLVSGLVMIETVTDHPAGHSPNWEQPARVARDVMSLVESVTTER